METGGELPGHDGAALQAQLIACIQESLAFYLVDNAIFLCERLVARVDLASDRDAGTLRVDRAWLEDKTATGHPAKRTMRATRLACERLANQLGAKLDFRAAES